MMPILIDLTFFGGGSGGGGFQGTKGAGNTNVPKYPGNNPSKQPGPGYKWRGSGDPSSGKGNWYNPTTDQTLHPDLNHPGPIGPHWDYKAPDGTWYRINPDGSVLPKH